MLRPGMTFVDVGANVGYFTLLAANAVQPKGRVIAFEPSHTLYAALASAVSKNRLSHVMPVNAGLSDQNGFIDLYLNPEFGNNSPTMVRHAASEVSRVTTQRLDDFLKAEHIERVDLMKIDVEGFEPAVLAGAGSLLKDGTIRAILCEFNDEWLRMNGSNPADLWNLLVEAGFRAASGATRTPRFRRGSVVNRMLLHRSAMAEERLRSS